MSPARRRPASQDPPPDTETATFEAAFAELQRVVDQLEGGSLDLESAVTLVDRGTHLAATCNRLVDDAELRVTRLAPEPATPLSDLPAEP